MNPKLVRKFMHALPSLLLFALVLGGIFFVFRYFDGETINAFIDRAGIWAPLALIVAKASTIVVAPLGGSPIYPLAGALFGFWEGAAYLLLGDMLGATISFWLSRIYGRKVVSYFFPDSRIIARILHALGTIKGFLIARVALIALPEAISYSAGLTKINFWLFFVVFSVTEIVPIAILASLGTFLREQGGGVWYTVALVAGMLAVATGLLAFARYVQKQSPDLKDVDIETV